MTQREVRAIQPVFFVRQNLAEGVTGPLRARRLIGVRQTFPRFLTLKTLFVGCAAGEGHLGVCQPEDLAWTAEALSSALKILAREAKAPLIVLKDFSARYRTALRGFANHGYVRIASMPMTQLRLAYRGFRGICRVVRQRDPQKLAPEISRHRAAGADHLRGAHRHHAV